MVLRILHQGLFIIFVMHASNFDFRSSIIQVHQLTIINDFEEVHGFNVEIRLKDQSCAFALTKASSPTEKTSSSASFKETLN